MKGAYEYDKVERERAKEHIVMITSVNRKRAKWIGCRNSMSAYYKLSSGMFVY